MRPRRVCCSEGFDARPNLRRLALIKDQRARAPCHAELGCRGSSGAPGRALPQQNIRVAQRRLADEERDHLDAAGEVAVAVVVERAIVVDDAAVGIERGRANNELVGG